MMEYQEYLKKILSDEEIEKLNDCYNKENTNGLRVNLLKTNKEHIGTILYLNKNHPFVKEAYIIENKEFRYGKDPLHYAGGYYLQEPSAMMVAHLLNVEKGDKVLDLCAAPGGKSSQVISYLENTGLLVSNDISNKRVQALSENVERMGASNTYVLNESIENIENKFYGFFDKVILDAPCSGQGMFRKNKEVLNDWTYNKTLSLANTNKELIMRAYNCLRKDGIMVYSTCTFTKEEDEEVVKYLLENTNASIMNIDMNKMFHEAFIDGAIRLYPFLFEGEGHFICLIKCNDEHECKVSKFNREAGRTEMKLYREFESQYLNIKLDGKFIKMGDELHFLKQEYFSLDRLKVIRNGLHLGTIKKDRFEPNHALAMFLNKGQVKNSIDFDHNDNKVISYLKGMTIEETTNKKGYVLVCVNGLSLGWGKDDGRIIKNLYPKGLRML